MLKNIKISFVIILFINTFAFNYKRGYYMLGVLVWIVVILLICFSVFGGPCLLPPVSYTHLTLPTN